MCRHNIFNVSYTRRDLKEHVPHLKEHAPPWIFYNLKVLRLFRSFWILFFYKYLNAIIKKNNICSKFVLIKFKEHWTLPPLLLSIILKCKVQYHGVYIILTNIILCLYAQYIWLQQNWKCWSRIPAGTLYSTKLLGSFMCLTDRADSDMGPFQKTMPPIFISEFFFS